MLQGRKLIIEDVPTSSKNQIFKDDETGCVISCAFKDVICSPLCAAAVLHGTQRCVSCNRNGAEHEFVIGTLKEDS